MKPVTFKEDHIRVTIDPRDNELTDKASIIDALKLFEDYVLLFMKDGYYFSSKPEPRITSTYVYFYGSSGWITIYHKGNEFLADIKGGFKGTKFITDTDKICKVFDQILVDYGLC